MPRPSPSGLHVTHGLGGGNASFDNAPFSSGGGPPGFIREDVVAFANGADGWIVSVWDRAMDKIQRLDFPAVAATRGRAAKMVHVALPPPKNLGMMKVATDANFLVAGGGHVACWLGAAGPERGLYCTTGFRQPDAGLLAMGPDGALGYKPSYYSFGPSVVRFVDGTEVVLTNGHATELQLLGGTKAIWTEDVAGPRVFGLPTPVCDATGGLWMPRAAMAGGQWWLCYFSGARGLVLHPFGSFRGFSVVPHGDAWPSLVQIAPNILRLYIASRLGEQAGEVWAVDYDVVNALIRNPWADQVWRPAEVVDIRFINPDPVTPPPPPPPKGTTMQLPRPIYDTYKAVADKFHSLHASQNDDDRREGNKRCVQTIRAKHHGSGDLDGSRYVCKTEHSNGWAAASKDTVGYVESPLPPQNGRESRMFMFDMVNGSSRAVNGYPIVADNHGGSEPNDTAYVLIPDAFDWLADEPVPVDPEDPPVDPDKPPVVIDNDTKALLVAINQSALRQEGLLKQQLEELQGMRAELKKAAVDIVKALSSFNIFRRSPRDGDST